MEDQRLEKVEKLHFLVSLPDVCIVFLSIEGLVRTKSGVNSPFILLALLCGSILLVDDSLMIQVSLFHPE